jgi:hypothetical protein
MKLQIDEVRQLVMPSVECQTPINNSYVVTESTLVPLAKDLTNKSPVYLSEENTDVLR